MCIDQRKIRILLPNSRDCSLNVIYAESVKTDLVTSLS